MENESTKQELDVGALEEPILASGGGSGPFVDEALFILGLIFPQHKDPYS